MSNASQKYTLDTQLIKRLAAQRGLTMSEVVDQTGSRANVYRALQGKQKVTVEILANLALVLLVDDVMSLIQVEVTA